MGLAGPKRRSKLSHDPNNTKWTSNTQSFGHRIMASQGWKPGEYLGAQDAPHAEFHTSANASHIRVTIKDDNLGLGAKNGSGVGHGECTGLDAFKNLLGRLNGVDEEELEKEQKSREDLKRAIYTERRWGSIRFVQGGLLVGDKIQSLIEGEAERLRKLAADSATSGGASRESSDTSDSNEEPEPKPVVARPKRSKKRQFEELEEASEAVAVEIKKLKKKRKSEMSPEEAAEITAAQEDVKASKKKSKRKRETEAEDEDDTTDVKKRKKKRDKKDKKEKKEKVRSKRDEESTKASSKKSERDKKKADSQPRAESIKDTQPPTKEATPSSALETESGRSTPIIMQGRHAVRARNIAQKRLASMDLASLNQIFMIKSQT